MKIFVNMKKLLSICMFAVCSLCIGGLQGCSLFGENEDNGGNAGLPEDVVNSYTPPEGKRVATFTTCYEDGTVRRDFSSLTPLRTFLSSQNQSKLKKKRTVLKNICFNLRRYGFFRHTVCINTHHCADIRNFSALLISID